MLVYIDNKEHTKIVESWIISNYHATKQRFGIFNKSSHLVKLILKSCKILYLS